MRATKSLEYIGEESDAYGRAANRAAKQAGFDLGYKSNRPWIARITGTDPTYTFAREFQTGQIDYSQANSSGSRGVYLHFFLEDGLYEVSERLSWKRTRRYFIRVQESKISEISQEELLALLPELPAQTKLLPQRKTRNPFLPQER